MRACWAAVRLLTVIASTCPDGPRPRPASATVRSAFPQHCLDSTGRVPPAPDGPVFAEDKRFTSQAAQVRGR
ncbi:hypothetical protein GCM10010297_17860 [Streptomyces malachitofuscus]|nr:hypothetical protein GCM10010297_17860 [Streptomyces malachitofuscus]